MLKNILFLSLAPFLFCTLSMAQTQKNMQLLGNLPYSQNLNDIWGWADTNGNEYALVGASNGASIVDVTDPANPKQLFFVPGPVTTWRDLKTWKHYCYVTNENQNGGGLAIIDLQYLPDSIKTYTWKGSGNVNFESAHNLYIDEKGYAYIFGADYSAGGAIIVDLNSNPTNPSVATVYDEAYLHDGFVRGDTLWGAELYNGWFSAVDVSDKNPSTIPASKIMATHPTPDNFTHNVWPSEDGDYLFTTDEVSDAYIGAYDVSDLSNIKEVDRIQSSPGQNVIPHNTHYLNGFLITSYYRDGVTIMDAEHPDNLVLTGYYDTSPLSGNGFNGCWGVYPYLPSGNIIASDIENGLYILGSDYLRGAYLEGTVRDSLNNNTINGVAVKITGVPGADATTGLSGDYKTGVADSGSYMVEFSKPGYITKTDTVTLDNGTVTQLDIKLVALIPFTLTGYIVDEETGKGIGGAQVWLFNQLYDYKTITDTSGKYVVPGVYGDTYDLISGQWGFVTKEKKGISYDQFSPVDTHVLATGYYDDFVFNFQWQVAGNAVSGIWERDEPVGTSYQGNMMNPGEDVKGDIGGLAYVTGNGGGSAGNDDVDDGRTTLVSPVFDLSEMNNPYISYARWFANDGGFGSPNDSLVIYLSNGNQKAMLDFIDASSSETSKWVGKKFKVSDFVTPTDSMRIVFTTADKPSSGHLVEAGVDLFQAFDSIQVPVAGFSADTVSGCAPLTVSFIDESDNFPDQWWWIIDDTDTLTGQNPVHTFDTAGTYSVKLITSNTAGTDSTEKIQYIEVLESPVVTATSTPEKNNQANGTATAVITGGVSPFTIEWDDPQHQNTETATGLKAGVYTVTVTDSNGCTDTASVRVDAATGIEWDKEKEVTIHPNPAKDVIYLQLKNPSGPLAIHLFNFQGQQVPATSIEERNGQWVLHLPKNLASGTYMVQVVTGSDSWSEQVVIQR